jgi:hypothetical protein
MPQTYRNAAKSTRDMAAGRRKQLLNMGLLAIGAIVIIGILLQNSAALQISGGGILVLLVAMRLISDLFDNYSRKKEKTIRRADRGADAEEAVGELLEQLDDRFVVIHDVDSAYGNIDHVVISQPGGIFLLETKSHRGTVTMTEDEILVNNRTPEKDFVAQALQNSYWLREEIGHLLSIQPWITPIVVFTNAFVKFGRPIKGVRVVNRKYLLETLQSPQTSSANNAMIWANREQITDLLTGQPPISSQKANLPPAVFCPNCGKKLVEKVAKSGVNAGKRFMVCPDYPKCKTAIQLGQVSF